MPSPYYVVPTMASGDWVTPSWLNTYLKNNLAALWVYTAAGQISYALSSSELAALDLVTGGLLYGGAGAPQWLAKPASLGFLQNDAAGVPSYFTGGSAYQLLRKNAGNTAFEWADLASLLQAAAMVASQAAEDLIVGASGTTVKRLAKGANRSLLRVSAAGVLEYAPIGAWSVAKRSTNLTGLSSADDQVITWDASEGESWHTTTKLTAPVDGDYEITAMIYVDTASTWRNYETELRKNGSTKFSKSKGWSESNYTFTGIHPPRILTLSAGDYIEAVVDNCNGTIYSDSYIQMKRVR